MQRPLMLALAAATLVVSAPAAFADNSGTVESRRVEYSDLDLSKREDAEIMLIRLRRAAGDVCYEQRAKSPLEWQAASRECIADTMDQSVAALNSPNVTALHRGDVSYTVAQTR